MAAGRPGSQPRERSRTPGELDVIFLLAGCEARRSRLQPSLRRALAGADFRVLERELAVRRLLPLIGSRLLKAAPGLVPGEFAEAVGRARAAARARGMAVEHATRLAVGWLGGAGIAALPLKGPLLAADAHGDIGLRDTADVDLLVPRARLAAAVRTLAGRGFSPAAGADERGDPAGLHVRLVRPAAPEVELHWRVAWYERAFSEEMLARAAAADDGMLRAQPADVAAALLLFHARDGFHGVRLAADIAAWWDRHRDALPEHCLEGHAARFPELRPALTAAARAVEELTGVPALRWLGAGATHGRRVALAVRLADWTQRGDRDQLAANISLVGGLLGPPGSTGAFARRELLAPGAGRAGQAAHAAKMCTRYAVALWRVRGGRPWAGPPAAAAG